MSVGQSASFIAYYRVSTSKQGVSGLGIEAQQTAVREYVQRSGANILAEFVEVESGRKSERPQLTLAINKCRRSKASLVIAKLDRLARNVHFVSGLMDSGVNFLALDMPSADRFMLHIYAAMAEEEGRRIGARTKSALLVAKTRGIQLGKNAQSLATVERDAAVAFAMTLLPELNRLKSLGYSIRRIANELNYKRVPARTGGRWHPTSVARLMRRLASSTDANSSGR